MNINFIILLIVCKGCRASIVYVMSTGYEENCIYINKICIFKDIGYESLLTQIYLTLLSCCVCECVYALYNNITETEFYC